MGCVFCSQSALKKRCFLNLKASRFLFRLWRSALRRSHSQPELHLRCPCTEKRRRNKASDTTLVALSETENDVSGPNDASEVGNRGAGDEVTIEGQLRALKTLVGYCKGQFPLGGGGFIYWSCPSIFQTVLFFQSVACNAHTYDERETSDKADVIIHPGNA